MRLADGYPFTIPAEVWPIIVWPLGPDGYPITTPPPGQTLPCKSKSETSNRYDDSFLGFAESIDTRNNSIWIAIWNTFSDKFNTDENSLPCVSGVTVNQYNLDPQTCLPRGVPIQTSGPIDMRYGMLLANIPSQLPVLLTQLKGINSTFNQKFIGNEVRDWYMVVTVKKADPNSKIPDQGFSPSVYQFRGPAIGPFPLQDDPLPLGTASKPYCLNPHLKADDSFTGPPYAFALSMFGGYPFSPSTDYFDSLEVQIDIASYSLLAANNTANNGRENLPGP